MEIAKDSIVKSVIEEHPETLAVFKQYGFHALANLLLRKTLGGITTIERGCRLHGVDLNTFLESLNRALLSGRGDHPATCACDRGAPHPEPDIPAADRSLVESIRQVNIATLVRKYPAVESVFVKYFGSGCFSCPAFGMEDVDFACSMHTTNPERFAHDCLAVIRKGCDCC